LSEAAGVALEKLISGTILVVNKFDGYNTLHLKNISSAPEESKYTDPPCSPIMHNLSGDHTPMWSLSTV
jgi:hypothetical protein